jgi:cyclopropane-fatty-acyl-phospholipid synthase
VSWQDPLVRSALVPDAALRFGIRGVCRHRLRMLAGSPAEQRARRDRLLAEMRESPIAVAEEAANDQHYHVDPQLFRLMLGPRLKYSACYWPAGVTTLAQAEDASLAQVCDRAGIDDGMAVLDLGCGWGALALWLAERYPASRVLALSGSATQRAFVQAEARLRGLTRLEVVAQDANDLRLDGTFDRVVSVEMFEHLRNWERMLGIVAGLLRPGGRVFCHVFTHHRHAYLYDDAGWMARRFFTGGMMPSEDLLPAAAEASGSLRPVEQWRLDGTHYQRTAEAWLANLDARADAARTVLARTHGRHAESRRREWRAFLMALAELWGYGGGTEWTVSHYLLERARGGS